MPKSPLTVEVPLNLQAKHSRVVHPPHYGGDTPTEPIKVIRAWGLNFALGNTVKYIARADHKGNRLEDLRKALFYLQDEIAAEERKET